MIYFFTMETFFSFISKLLMFPGNQSSYCNYLLTKYPNIIIIKIILFNLFNNLYDEYKNYKPQELKASNEREDLILQIDENRFAIIELGLYIDLYSNDTNILNKYNSYLKKEKELITIYESKYGPMTLNSPVQTNIWLWNNSPWPWEVQK